jgi:hypothetical protein
MAETSLVSQRSEWDAETLQEQQGSGEKMTRRFEEANARMKANTAQLR